MICWQPCLKLRCLENINVVALLEKRRVPLLTTSRYVRLPWRASHHPIVVMRLSCCIVLLLSFVEMGVADNKYCSMDKSHTMCRYKGMGDACQLPDQRGLLKKDAQVLVNMHNTYRSQVANGEVQCQDGALPSAANMNILEWDSELAAIAQRWADQCPTEKDVKRDTKSFTVGQILHSQKQMQDPNRDWGDYVINMYIGRKSDKFSSSYVKRFPSGADDKVVWFANIIAGETRVMGCGFIRDNREDHYASHFVCNYGPAGAVAGKSLYTVGKACSACPSNHVCSDMYPGLCMRSDARIENGTIVGRSEASTTIYPIHPVVILLIASLVIVGYP